MVIIFVSMAIYTDTPVIYTDTNSNPRIIFTCGYDKGISVELFFMHDIISLMYSLFKKENKE